MAGPYYFDDEPDDLFRIGGGPYPYPGYPYSGLANRGGSGAFALFMVLAVLVVAGIGLAVFFIMRPTTGPGIRAFNTKIPFDKGFKLQVNAPERVSVSTAEGYPVLTVSIEPGDKELVTGKSDRQRNELRYTDPTLGVRPGSVVTYAWEVRINDYGDLAVDGRDFYYVTQIKSNQESSKPVFGVGIKRGQWAVYTSNAASETTPLMPIATGVWQLVTCTVDWSRKQISVAWTFADKKNSYTSDISSASEVYLKFGQYRSVPNTARRTCSSSYRNAGVFRAMN